MHSLLKSIRDILTKKKITDFEIFFVSAAGTALEVKRGAIDSLEKKNGQGFGLRVKNAGRLGFAYGNDFSRTAIESVVDSCLASAAFSLPTPITFATQDLMPEGLNLCDSSFDHLTTEKRLALLETIPAELKKIDKRLSLNFSSIEDEKRAVHLVTSAGADLFCEKTVFNFSLGVVARDKQGEEIIYDMDTRCHVDGLQIHDTVTDAARHALWVLGGKPVPRFLGPAVIYRDVACELLEVLWQSFSGENIFKKKSVLTGKVGQKIYADTVTIIDDGIMKATPGSSPFDDEGNVRQTTTLVKNGVLQNFLYDSFWAIEAGKKSTGNLSRENFSTRPELSPSNFYIGGGGTSKMADGDASTGGFETRPYVIDDLFLTMGEGVLITDVIGMHNADFDSGEFSVGVAGAFVKNGRVTQALSGMVWRGNLHSILKQVLGRASDFKFYGSFGSPSLLVSDVELIGA